MSAEPPLPPGHPDAKRGALELEIISDTVRLHDFRSEWSDLVNSISPATPFQTPEWLTIWWEHFGSGHLRVMAFRDGGQLVGVMPMFLHEWRRHRQLSLIGSGISDYLEPVFAPDHSSRIVIRIARELKKWQDWDICDWRDLSRDTPLGFLGTVVADAPCTTIPIEHPFQFYLASRPKDLRDNLRRYRTKAEAAAPITFEVTGAAEESLMHALIDLHRFRPESAGQIGAIDATRFEGFIRSLAAAFAERGWLSLFAIRFGGRIAAVLLAFTWRTKIFSYLSAGDPRYEALGFGRELLAQAIRYAHENGCRGWDFLRGDEQYKFPWGALPIEKRRVIIQR